MKINEIKFDTNELKNLKRQPYVDNYPIVYLLEGKKEIYVGESTNAVSRMKQHIKDPRRKVMDKALIINDSEFNKSATLDIESKLIQYLSVEGKYKLQNGNAGLTNHDYYNRHLYSAKFDIIWDKLKQMNITTNELVDLRNSDLFKFSPYKSLTDDQLNAAQDIITLLMSNKENNFVVRGSQGTGKTILATYLVKRLTDGILFNEASEEVERKEFKVGLVMPQTSLRHSLKQVFKNVKNLSASMVIGPNDVIKEHYDVLIVDEAHRLKRRKNIPNFGSYDNVNRKLGLDKEANQLEWLKRSTDNLILFYDTSQSIMPSDIDEKSFKNFIGEFNTLNLTTQKRVKGGEVYLNFIDNLLFGENKEKPNFGNYDFRIIDNAKELKSLIKQRNEEVGLSRIVSGISWSWKKNNPDKIDDFILDGEGFIWNSTIKNWVNSPNAINEVGCIHTVQGYDLNYVGVILGKEIVYRNGRITIDKSQYTDSNGKRGIESDKELEIKIKNIYKVLLGRGIKGTYIYVCDDKLREFLNNIK